MFICLYHRFVYRLPDKLLGCCRVRPAVSVVGAFGSSSRSRRAGALQPLQKDPARLLLGGGRRAHQRRLPSREQQLDEHIQLLVESSLKCVLEMRAQRAHQGAYLIHQYEEHRKAAGEHDGGPHVRYAQLGHGERKLVAARAFSALRHAATRSNGIHAPFNTFQNV